MAAWPDGGSGDGEKRSVRDIFWRSSQSALQVDWIGGEGSGGIRVSP